MDAFIYDWSQYFGLYVSPIILVSRVLKKMENCKAKGILVLPEWRSAYFWPLLCANDREVKPFILDWMYLPTEKCFYTPCKNGIGIFGTEDLKFNMLALYVNFNNDQGQSNVSDFSCRAYAFYYLLVSTNRVPVSAIRRKRDKIKTQFTEVRLSF